MVMNCDFLNLRAHSDAPKAARDPSVPHIIRSTADGKDRYFDMLKRNPGPWLLIGELPCRSSKAKRDLRRIS